MEAKFYALVPLLVLLVLRLRSRVVILGVVLAIAAVSPVVRGIGFPRLETIDYQTFWRVFRSPFHACLEPLMFGFLVAILEARGFLRLSEQTARRVFAASLAALIVVLCGHEFLAEIDIWDAVFQPAGLAPLFTLLLAAAINLEGARLPLTGAFRFGDGRVLGDLCVAEPAACHSDPCLCRASVSGAKIRACADGHRARATGDMAGG